MFAELMPEPGVDPARAAEKLRLVIKRLQGNLTSIERCRKPVHDLRQRSYEPIRAFLREHRGALCAQVTVRDDRLLVNGGCQTGDTARGGLTEL